VEIGLLQGPPGMPHADRQHHRGRREALFRPLVEPADRGPSDLRGIRSPALPETGDPVLPVGATRQAQELVGHGVSRGRLIQAGEPHLDAVLPVVRSAVVRRGDAPDREHGDPLAGGDAAGLVVPVDLDRVAEAAAPGWSVAVRDRGHGDRRGWRPGRRRDDRRSLGSGRLRAGGRCAASAAGEQRGRRGPQYDDQCDDRDDLLQASLPTTTPDPGETLLRHQGSHTRQDDERHAVLGGGDARDAGRRSVRLPLAKSCLPLVCAETLWTTSVVR
jgi:hypothetical protein